MEEMELLEALVYIRDTTTDMSTMHKIDRLMIKRWGSKEKWGETVR